MLVELIVSALVASFVAVVVLGHVVLAAAIIQCVGGAPTGRPAAPSSDRHHPRHRRRHPIRNVAANERCWARRHRGVNLSSCVTRLTVMHHQQ